MEPQTRSADAMIQILMKDPKRLDALKANPLPELQSLREEALKETGPAYLTDKWLYRMVIMALGAVLIAAAGGAIALSVIHSDKEIPQILVALGSAAVGALAGLLAPSPVSGK